MRIQSVTPYELGRASTDIDDENGPSTVKGPPSRHERQTAFLVTRQLGLDSDDVTRPDEELVAICRIARGRGRRHTRLRHAEPIDHAAILAEYPKGSFDRVRGQLARCIDTLTEASDAHQPLDRARSVVHQ